MKSANDGTKLQGTPRSDEPQVPTPQTGKNPKDARGDEDKQVKNQKDLGVEADHKTEEMEKGDRGTFP